MKTALVWALLSIPLALMVAGCGQTGTPPPDEETRIKTALNKLDPADRKLAEEQKYCAVETGNRLGKMGPPAKVMIKDQPVFLCCKGCEKAAETDPDGTLATVKKLKEKQQTHH